MNLTKNKKSKIILFVLDGVGGIPYPKLTELEAAKTPYLDKLVKKSETVAHIPILSGLTPGSGAAHLSLFGYDPLSYDIGRGVLEALGLDVALTDKDLLIRGNFSTIKETIDNAEIFYKKSFIAISGIPLKSRFSVIVARRVYRKIGDYILKQNNIDNYNKAGKIYVPVFEKVIQTFLSIIDFVKLLFVKELIYDNHINHNILEKEVNLNERI